MLFDRSRFSRDDFEREVLAEIAYLRGLHGDNAYRAAVERAGRPRLRGERRRVLAAVVKRLAPDKREIKSRS